MRAILLSIGFVLACGDGSDAGSPARDNGAGFVFTDTQTSPPGSSKPTISFLAPKAGAVIDLGESIEVALAVGDGIDDVHSLEVTLESEALGVILKQAPSTTTVTATVTTLTVGAHTLTASAKDHDGNVAQASVSVVINGAPETCVATLSPEEPKTDDELEVDASAQDPNGDVPTFSYTWQRDGIDVDGLLDAKSVPSPETAKGEHWSVTVVPSDGRLTGPSCQATLTIASARRGCAPPCAVRRTTRALATQPMACSARRTRTSATGRRRVKTTCATLACR